MFKDCGVKALSVDSDVLSEVIISTDDILTLMESTDKDIKNSIL